MESLLCPGNTISDGIVSFEATSRGNSTSTFFFGFDGTQSRKWKRKYGVQYRNQNSETPFPNGDGGGGG